MLFKFYYILKDDRKLHTPKIKIKFQYCFKSIIKKTMISIVILIGNKNYQENKKLNGKKNPKEQLPLWDRRSYTMLHYKTF